MYILDANNMRIKLSINELLSIELLLSEEIRFTNGFIKVYFFFASSSPKQCPYYSYMYIVHVRCMYEQNNKNGSIACKMYHSVIKT